MKTVHEEKAEFMKQYVLNRARAICRGELSGVGAAKEASKAWGEIKDIIHKDMEKELG